MICCLNPECQQPLNQDDRQLCVTCQVPLKLRLRNRYQPIKPLGKGGFGNTYLAKDCDRLDELCVIKQLTFHSDRGAVVSKAKQLFELEARQLQKLGQHSQIPALLAYFEADNYLYLVQEFVDGKNLFEKVKTEGIFNQNQIETFLLDILPVLEFVHAQNVIHRDLKPGNIMWRDKDKKHVLIDFGISKVVNPSNTVSTGTIIGSQGYSPPEQILKGKVFPSSDLFSLGASCFYLLSGISPFNLWVDRGYSWLDNWQELIKIDLDSKLAAVLNRLLQKDLSKRYQNAGEVIKDLRNYAPEFETKKTQDCSTLLDTSIERKIKKQYLVKQHFVPIAIGMTLALGAGFSGLYFLADKNPQKAVIRVENKAKFSIERVNNIKINSAAEVWSLAISDRNIIASGSNNGAIALYNSLTGQLKNQLPSEHKNVIRSLIFIPNTNRLISGDGDGIIKIWNLENLQLIKEFSGHFGSIWSLAISPDGETLISSSEDKNIIVWDLKNGEQTFNSAKHSARVYSVAFSPNGKIFASSGADNQIKIWDASNFKLLNTLSGHQNAVRAIAISPDGKYLVSGSWDKTVKIWELQSGQLIHTLEGHQNRVVTVAFSKDSQTVFSGAIDNSIKIWNVKEGKLINTLDRHSDWVLALASSQKDNLLISGGKDGAIELWEYKYD